MADDVVTYAGTWVGRVTWRRFDVDRGESGRGELRAGMLPCVTQAEAVLATTRAEAVAVSWPNRPGHRHTEMGESEHGGGRVRRRSEGYAKVVCGIIRWAAMDAQEVHDESLAIGLGEREQPTRRTGCPGGARCDCRARSKRRGVIVEGAARCVVGRESR